MRMYIGLDVHCKETVYVVQDGAGAVVGGGRAPTTEEGLAEMLRQVGAPAGTKVGLETGTQATWVARCLEALGMEPVVIDAREVRAKARRVGQKSDRRDAWEICDGLRRGLYSAIVYVPPLAIERLRRIVSRRRHFVKVRTQQINAARFVLRSHGLRGVCGRLKTWAAWEKLLAHRAVQGVGEHVAMHAAVWRMAQENVSRLDRELVEAARPFAAIAARLRTFPAVGAITAATYIAVLGTPERFPSSSHVVSYIGLAPSGYDTADRQRHGAITKRGSAELRAMLCEVAHHARHARHPLNPYFNAVVPRGGYKKAVIAVSQRTARILYRMWRDQKDFDVDKLNVEPVHKSRTRTFYWQIKKPQEVTVAR